MSVKLIRLSNSLSYHKNSKKRDYSTFRKILKLCNVKKRSCNKVSELYCSLEKERCSSIKSGSSNSFQ